MYMCGRLFAMLVLKFVSITANWLNKHVALCVNSPRLTYMKVKPPTRLKKRKRDKVGNPINNIKSSARNMAANNNRLKFYKYTESLVVLYSSV